MRSLLAWSLRLMLMAFSLVVGLVAIEIYLRASDYGSQDVYTRHANVPVMTQPDARLGWKPKPGVYVYPGYAARADGSPPADVRVTFTQELRRSTGPALGDERDAIALFGCSFTQGQAISDDETFAWKLQQRLRRPVRNYGVQGYGTYQAYLRLEEALRSDAPPSLVVYGFAGFHARRNAADVSWLKALRGFDTGDPIALPYATVASDGSLIHHDPIAYPKGLLHHEVRVYKLLYESGLTLLAAWRRHNRVETTIAIIRNMERASREHGAKFAVVELSRVKRRHADRYGRFWQESGIPYLECRAKTDEAHQVRGEGHPNGLANTEYADCIAEGLAQRGL